MSPVPLLEPLPWLSRTAIARLGSTPPRSRRRGPRDSARSVAAGNRQPGRLGAFSAQIVHAGVYADSIFQNVSVISEYWTADLADGVSAWSQGIPRVFKRKHLASPNQFPIALSNAADAERPRLTERASQLPGKAGVCRLGGRPWKTAVKSSSWADVVLITPRSPRGMVGSLIARGAAKIRLTSVRVLADLPAERCGTPPRGRCAEMSLRRRQLRYNPARPTRASTQARSNRRQTDALASRRKRQHLAMEGRRPVRSKIRHGEDQPAAACPRLPPPPRPRGRSLSRVNPCRSRHQQGARRRRPWLRGWWRGRPASGRRGATGTSLVRRC